MARKEYKEQLKEQYSTMSEIEQLKLNKQLAIDNQTHWQEFSKLEDMCSDNKVYSDDDILAQFGKSRNAYNIWRDIIVMQEVLKEVLGI